MIILITGLLFWIASTDDDGNFWRAKQSDVGVTREEG